MKARIALALLLTSLVLTGCQAAPRGPAVEAADAPQLVKELTDQTTIYTCTVCKMEFDRAGKCYMCDVDLVETRVAYLCPADNQPVERAGPCPRCDMQAMIVRTAAHESAAEGGATDGPSKAAGGR